MSGDTRILSGVISYKDKDGVPFSRELKTNVAMANKVSLRGDEVNSEFANLQWYPGFMTRGEMLECLRPIFPEPPKDPCPKKRIYLPFKMSEG